ncbi:IclR family transcriptional regulator [Anaerotignum sp. MB30-C6]|uniref:IclR family transcriptional regulator n=1 Tax=Anaerotignum sp. MB30-C6 TaxID=3070814 RepID=UPI0027DBE855|nr:IclR family transcriptional regulator [Anaerotignum sp. MB30-C6]WMI82328.1 IclR family transcriptional regulator [Anaerotignum sp. MB30-C6]
MSNYMENSSYKPKYPVQTLGKALDVLLYIKNNASADGVSIAELSEYLNMGKSTVHRLLDTLLAYNFVEKTYSTSSYKLGWGIYDIGSSVPFQHSLNNTNFYPLLEELCNECSETVNFGIVNNNSIVILYKAEPNIKIRANVNIGGNEPLYCTAIGKLFLSTFSVQEVKDYFNHVEVVNYTNNTITTAEKMFPELSKITKNGYSIDNEEFYVGLICVAIPVYDYSGNLVAGISVSGPSERMVQNKIDAVLPKLKSTCEKLSMYLGYR